MQWQLQQAKNQLSRVVQAAQDEGPQVITVHGKETAILLSMEEYRHLVSRQGSLVEFFQRSPLRGVDLQIERSKETTSTHRDIEW